MSCLDCMFFWCMVVNTLKTSWFGLSNLDVVLAFHFWAFHFWAHTLKAWVQVQTQTYQNPEWVLLQSLLLACLLVCLSVCLLVCLLARLFLFGVVCHVDGGSARNHREKLCSIAVVSKSRMENAITIYDDPSPASAPRGRGWQHQKPQTQVLVSRCGFQKSNGACNGSWYW